MMGFQSPLTDLDEKIESYENLIIYQKNEINKTETLISNFQVCLSQQNEALKKFLEEKQKLEAEKIKYNSHTTANNEKEEINTLPINNTIENKADKSLSKKDELKRSENNTNLKRKASNGDDETIKKILPVNNTIENKADKSLLKKDELKPSENCTNLKRKATNGDGETIKKITFIKNIDLKTQLDTLHIPEIKNNTVHKILVYDNDIYIGGSNGLLLRHTSNYTHIYETNTNEDILQIEIIKNQITLSINVFTNTKIITYEDVTWYTQRKEVHIPGVGEVTADSNVLYIPFKKGLLKKLEDGSVKASPYIKSKLLCFLPCPGKSKLALILPEDKLLYTTLKEEPREFRPIRGLINIQGMKLMLTYYFVCYSRKDIWLLNSGFQIMHRLKFKEEIKIVDVFEGFVVAVDVENVVHMYSLITARRLDVQMIYEESIEGTVTSAAFVDNNVYMAVGSEIVIIKYNI